MTTTEWIMTATLSLILLPCVVYLVCKMAAEGWFRGKAQATRLENDNDNLPKKGKQPDGNDETR